ncbi:MAG: histidinol dehydrogenase [Prochloraceae cyanobacterium]|nr:histidinol dehydrogenase [Prochloraceae cyanobacterium]
MLRIITQLAEAKTELGRIGERARDEQIKIPEAAVRNILETVKRQGNKALLDYAKKFDWGQTLSLGNMRVSGSELDAAYQQISKELLDAIQLAKTNIEAFHKQHLPQSWVQFEEDNVVLGKRYTPVDRAGIYVPGGIKSYPSTVLTNAIPAKIARVPQIVMVTPPGGVDSKINPAVLVAAQEAGIEEIYRIGGALAIAALTYGTETIPKVDVIAGKGDIEVAIAKKLVYPTVGIDSVGGPPEIIIVADDQANPQVLAIDLLAQAEQDPMGAAILLTTSMSLAKKVQYEVEKQLENHPSRIPTEKAIAHYGLVVVVEYLEEAAELSNLFAPQKLQLEVAEPWELLEQIRHAGAIFLGNSTPKAVGDYLAGPNSNLPTSGSARYASALGVEYFIKHSSLIEYSSTALKKVSSAIEILALAEGSHSLLHSVRARSQRQDKQIDK